MKNPVSLSLLWLLACAPLSSAIAQSAEPDHFGFGREVSAREIAEWDRDVRADGTGLPPGRGTVAAGAQTFRDKCAACHGSEGQGGPNDKLVGVFEPGVNHSLGTTAKTIGNYWPYATTLFDYILRAMPHNAPGSLTTQEVYDLCAWLLFRNGVIDEQTGIDQTTLPAIRMPARSLFYWSDEVAAE